MAFWDDVQFVAFVAVVLALLAGYGTGRWITRFVCARLRSRGEGATAEVAAPAAGDERPPTPGVVVWESLYNNKLLAVLLTLVVLIVYGQVFRSNGIPSLFWQETIMGQWAAGFGVALLIIELLYATYIVDDVAQDTWRSATADLPGLTPVRRLWAFLVTTTLPFLVLAALPAVLPVFRPKVDGHLQTVVAWPWLLGLGAGALLIAAVVYFRVRATIAWWRLGAQGRQGRTKAEFLAEAEQDIRYANPANLLLIFVGIYLVSLLIGSDRFSNAGLLICVFLGMIAAFYAVLANSRRSYQLAALAVAAWGLFANSDPYKLRFPGLQPYYTNKQTRVTLEPVPDDIKTNPPLAKRPASNLILNRWLRYAEGEPARRPRREDEASKDKPKLVLVTVSGGAIRAAIWSAVVLTRLERRIPGFEKHVRIITGASGGMLGAAYYTTTLHEANRLRKDPVEYHKRIVDDLSGTVGPDGAYEPHDFLTPVVTRLVLRDVPQIFVRTVQDSDRGSALEEGWDRWTDHSLSTPVASLAPMENHGRLPSLIFSPMIVEDGRRLLISNLDLDALTENRASRVSGDTDSEKLDDLIKREGLYSRAAVEFSRLFPGATGFTVATAVRMNASFPYISPAVSLPTNPPRRVVDAGYYDNYGVDLASRWIMQNGEWLAENTSGVVLIQVRAFTNEVQLQKLTTPVALPQPARAAGLGDGDRDDATPSPAEPGPSLLDRATGILASGSQFLTSPIDGFASARTAINYYRNDEEIAYVGAWFRARMHSPRFFTSVVFTCSDLEGGDDKAKPGDKAARSLREETLSWIIGLEEKRAVVAGMDRPNNKARLDNLVKWWADQHLHDAQGRPTPTRRRARVVPDAPR